MLLIGFVPLMLKNYSGLKQRKESSDKLFFILRYHVLVFVASCCCVSPDSGSITSLSSIYPLFVYLFEKQRK